MTPCGLRLSCAFVLLSVAACVNSASLGDALVTIYTDPSAPEFESYLVRDKREPDALERRHHHHHHHLLHGGGGGGGGEEEYYSKPSTCNKCGGGGGGGPVATFAQSSAGTISGGGHGGHGGHGSPASQSVSQSAAYNIGPFSASFSASQSNGGGGYGGFF